MARKKKTTLEDIGFGFLVIVLLGGVIAFLPLHIIMMMFNGIYWAEHNTWFTWKLSFSLSFLTYLAFIFGGPTLDHIEKRKEEDREWKQQRADEALLATKIATKRAMPNVAAFMREIDKEASLLPTRPIPAICNVYYELITYILAGMWGQFNSRDHVPDNSSTRSMAQDFIERLTTRHSPEALKPIILGGISSLAECLPSTLLVTQGNPTTQPLLIHGEVVLLRTFILPAPFEDTSGGRYWEAEKFERMLKAASIRVPFSITDEKRFENGFIVGARGTGKTELIFSMIHADLDRVARNECSVVVMDSQGEHELIGKVKNLKRFGKGGDLEGKLIYLAPDPEYPLQLNIFDLGKNRIVAPTARERAIQRRASKELLDFVFSTFLKEDSKLTGKQEDLFTYVVELCGVIPNANLATLLQVLKLRTIDTYHQQFVDQLSDAAQDFFNHLFNNQKEMAETKPQVLRRVLSILRDEEFRAMFSAPKCLIDFSTLFDKSSVIVINLDRLLMGETGTAVLGKFLMAMIIRDLQERLLVPRSKRHSVFMYADECHDYCADNPKMSIIANQGRKLNFSLFAATQSIDNITNEKIRKELMRAACKFVKTKDDSEAATFARPMNTEAEFIANLPKYHFAMHILDETPRAVDVMATLVDNPPQMSQAEIDAINLDMRRRFAKPLKEARPQQPEPPDEEDNFDGETIDAEFEEVDPNDEEKVVYLRLPPPDPNEIKPGKRRRKK